MKRYGIIHEKNPREILLLRGLGCRWQTADSMMCDIQTGLAHFERVCVNIFNENQTSFTPDKDVIAQFINRVMPRFIDDDRVDILLENTAFGVGGEDSDNEK